MGVYWIMDRMRGGNGNPEYHFVKEERGKCIVGRKRWLITKQENIILITPISPCKRRLVKIHTFFRILNEA